MKHSHEHHHEHHHDCSCGTEGHEHQGCLSLIHIFTNLGSIAHGSNHELTPAIHHHGRTEDDVARIGTIATACLLYTSQ